MKKALLYNGEVDLIRDDDHQYWVNGEKKKGVTGTIRNLIAKPGLMPWALEMGAKYLRSNLKVGDFVTENLVNDLCAGIKTASNVIRDAAGDVGTAAHGWIEQWTESRIGYGPEPDMPDSIPVRMAVNGFLNECKYFEFISSENPVYSLLHDRCGTMDSIIRKEVTDLANATLAGMYVLPAKKKKTGLLDYKTSSGFYWDQILQALIYAVFHNEELSYCGKTELVEFIQIMRLDKTSGQAFAGPEIEVGPEASRIVTSFFYLADRMEEFESLCKGLNPRKQYNRKKKDWRQ